MAHYQEHGPSISKGCRPDSVSHASAYKSLVARAAICQPAWAVDTNYIALGIDYSYFVESFEVLAVKSEQMSELVL